MRRAASACLLLLCSASGVAEEVLEEVRVIGVAPRSQSIDVARFPFAVQSFDQAQIATTGFYSLTDLLVERGVSVSVNAAQNNRLQPDVQYRGFTASPLLGLSQGIAVYHNGARLNEPFGDTVNWDLLSPFGVRRMDLIGGANPVFGLNAVGGALVVSGATGFNDPGGRLQVTRGAHLSSEYAASYGVNSGSLGLFVAADAMDEAGWRDYSDSSARRLYMALSWREARSEIDLFWNWADTELTGNGAAPEALLAVDRNAVFTHPDVTGNDLEMVTLNIRHAPRMQGEFSFSAFFRSLDTTTFNADGSEYEPCDDDDVAPASGAQWLCDEDDIPVQDASGRLVSAGYNALNNDSKREQESYGFTLQWATDSSSEAPQWLLGVDYFFGDTAFDSRSEFATLTDDRGTVGSGLLDQEGFTALDSELETLALFVSMSVNPSPALTVTSSLRYNQTRVQGKDRSGERSELNAIHDYRNLNGGLGFTLDIKPSVVGYANLQTTVRIPTPVELSCSHPEAPCRLPNAFLADPPLDQVRSYSGEFGLRGSAGMLGYFRVGAFMTHSDNDIVFQTTGGVSGNQGFFQNIVDTRRAGLELELNGQYHSGEWYLGYTWLQARFKNGFLSRSPNHPQHQDGTLVVESGSDIPGLPDHNLKLGATFSASQYLTLSADLRFNDGQYLRGDEANRETKTNAYWVLDLGAEMRFGERFFGQLRLENALDNDYETFGLFGEADEILGDDFEQARRFVGPAMPRTWWVTIGFRW